MLRASHAPQGDMNYLKGNCGSMPNVYLSHLFSIRRKRISTRKEVQQCNETLLFEHKRLGTLHPRVATGLPNAPAQIAGAASRQVPGIDVAKSTALWHAAKPFTCC